MKTSPHPTTPTAPNIPQKAGRDCHERLVHGRFTPSEKKKMNNIESLITGLGIKLSEVRDEAYKIASALYDEGKSDQMQVYHEIADEISAINNKLTELLAEKMNDAAKASIAAINEDLGL